MKKTRGIVVDFPRLVWTFIQLILLREQLCKWFKYYGLYFHQNKENLSENILSQEAELGQPQEIRSNAILLGGRCKVHAPPSFITWYMNSFAADNKVLQMVVKSDKKK